MKSLLADVDAQRRLRFSAKIDYVTLASPQGKRELPNVTGRVFWSRRRHWKTYTIHDPSPADLWKLARDAADPVIEELEVSLDIGCSSEIPQADRLQLVREVMVHLIAKGLDPRGGPMMKNQFRALYKPGDGTQKGSVRPFNMGLPSPDDQQLHGGRHDCVQVKAYLKVRDQGQDLPGEDCVARVEVRLRGEGLAHHRLSRVSDLLTFEFRKSLTPYLRFVRGVRLNGPEAFSAQQCFLAQRVWERAGVGGCSGFGWLQRRKHRVLRDAEMNNRVGQALHRLERACRRISCAAGASVPAKF